MTFTIVSPEGAEYGCESLTVFRDHYKPQGYKIAREQPPYTDWGVPEGAENDELTAKPKVEKPTAQRASKKAEKPQEPATDAA
jgi:hypothetical protein